MCHQDTKATKNLSELNQELWEASQRNQIKYLSETVAHMSLWCKISISGDKIYQAGPMKAYGIRAYVHWLGNTSLIKEDCLTEVTEEDLKIPENLPVSKILT